MSRYAPWIAAALLCVWAPAWAADAAGAKAAGDTGAQAAAVAELIEQIKRADDPDVAAQAYARACSLAPSDASPRIAQMRRMLQLGKPQLAVYAARALLRIQPDHALARAVSGYHHGTHKHYAQALEETVLALAALADDEGVLNNAGQLVAWGECQKPAHKLSSRAEPVLSAKRSSLMGKSKFADGYRRIKDHYERFRQSQKQMDEKIAAAEKKLLTQRDELKQIDAEIAGLKKRVRDHRREIRHLRDEERDRREEREGRDGHRSLRDRVWRGRDDGWYGDRIRQHERAIDRLENQIRQEFSDGKPKLKAYYKGKAELAKMKNDRRQMRDGVEKAFRWSPPGVDGVVTPESKAPAKPAEKPAELKVVGGAAGQEADAARMLKMAKVYLSAGQKNKALTLLQKLITNYTNTVAGKEAMKIVQEMD